MKHIKMLQILVVLLFVTAFLAVQGGQDQAQEDKVIRIAMVNYILGAPYFVGMSEAVIEEASHYSNIEVIVTDAGVDPNKFIADMRGVIDLDVDGIIINATGILDATDEVLAVIAKADVPVVLVDRLIVGAEFTSWIGPDNFAIGQNNGTYIVERLNGQGRMVVLRGGPEENPIGAARTTGVLSVVEQHEGVEVIFASEFGGWSTEGGYTLMEALLQEYNHVDVVFCENDAMCLGAQIAIEDAGRSNEMFLVGVDGQKEALLQILNDTNYAATGLNSSDQIGRAAFHRLVAILAGAQAPTETTLPSPLITDENVERFYNPDSTF
jgi:ribose transport system substrate-binding protein